MYGRYLGVDLKSIASQIDTTTQMKVEGYQYLTNRAAVQPKTKPDPELTFSAAPAPKNSGSWLPLLVLGGTVVVAIVGFVIWSNVNRLSDAPPSAPAKNPTPQDKAAAVEPLAHAPTPRPATPVPAVPPPQAPAPPGTDTATPRPALISTPETGSAAVPADGEIPRARPISPVAKMAASDSDALAELSPPRPRVISQGVTATPPASPPAQPVIAEGENSALAADPETTVLEPKRKSWVIIRSGPGGQVLFEDYLYPSAKPLRLPRGRYFIELKDAEAVEISRNGQHIGYSTPGVLIE
jgi:hypothetical protein